MIAPPTIYQPPNQNQFEEEKEERPLQIPEANNQVDESELERIRALAQFNKELQMLQQTHPQQEIQDESSVEKGKKAKKPKKKGKGKKDKKKIS